MAYLERGAPPVQVASWQETVARANLAPGPGGACMVPVALDGWPDARAQLVALWPSRQIAAHTDPPIKGRRYHIPIETNDGCWVFHGGEWAQLKVGYCYEMDPTVIHGAVNWGSAVRVHLMVDVL